MSFVAQTLYRVEPGCLSSGPDPEDQADAYRDADAGHYGPYRNRRGQLGYEEHDNPAHDDGEDDPDQAAQQRQSHGFEEELGDDVAAPRAYRLPDAYLLRPLGHADEHDVHHTDAPHEQAHARNSDHDHSERARDAIELRDEPVGGSEVEVVRVAELHSPLAA